MRGTYRYHYSNLMVLCGTRLQKKKGLFSPGGNACSISAMGWYGYGKGKG